MDNNTIANELREIRKSLASATYGVAKDDSTSALVYLSDVADRIDILLSGVTTDTPKYPVDNVPLTNIERFWRSFK